MQRGWMMRWRLRGWLGGRELRLIIDESGSVIGSSPECAHVLADPTVSRRHVELVPAGEHLLMRDLGSRNGTWVDGVRQHGTTELGPGQQLRLGDVDLVVGRVKAEDAIAVIGATDGEGWSAPSGLPAATLVSAGVVRFCLREFEPLLLRIAADASDDEVAALIVNTLVAAQVGSGASILRDASVMVACAGHLEGEAVSCTRGNRRLCIHGVAREDRPGAESIARMLLAVVELAARPLLPAAETDSPPIAEMPLLTASPVLRDIYRSAARLARSRLNVLITGESGTGKELLARYLHQASGEPDGLFLVLNCAALPADLLDAELFGIEAGVATGVQARAGRFELAHGGTVFLDEVGDMHPDTQARILRVLQEKQVYRVGSHKPRPADVRIIAATHRDLPTMVKDGTFRLDLFHRIADWRAELPPLRERREDIPGLAALLLARACATRGIRSGGLTQATIDALRSHSWPGNVRELEREMARLALFVEDGEPVTSDLLRADIREAGDAAPEGATLAVALADAERRIIAAALARTGGRVSEAARDLGISRATLYRRLEHSGLEGKTDSPT